MAEVITVAKPSAVATWTGDQAALMPGALRSVEPIHRSFEAVSAWVDKADDVVEALQVAIDGVKALAYAQNSTSLHLSGALIADSVTVDKDLTVTEDAIIAGKLTGTSATFTGDISAKNIAFGTTSFVVGTGITYSTKIDFGKTFSVAPTVVVTAVSAGSGIQACVKPASVDETGFMIAALRAASMSTTFNWIAIGTPGVV